MLLMRIKIGRVVDVSKDVNLADLGPLDRIIASAKNAYYNTSMYKRRFAETEEKKEEQRRKVRETLTESLLSVISVELENNKTLRDKDDKALAVLLKVPSRFKNFLVDVLDSHEFDAYSTTIIPPDRSLSKFVEAPYLVYVENRGGLE